MQCSKCNHLLETGWLFCPQCGSSTGESSSTPVWDNAASSADDVLAAIVQNAAASANIVRNQKWDNVRATIAAISQKCDSEPGAAKMHLAKLMEEIEVLAATIRGLEQEVQRANAEARMRGDLEREANRIKQEFKPSDDKGPHHVTWKPNVGF
jgi:hypothetical protein